MGSEKAGFNRPAMTEDLSPRRSSHSIPDLRAGYSPAKPLTCFAPACGGLTFPSLFEQAMHIKERHPDYASGGDPLPATTPFRVKHERRSLKSERPPSPFSSQLNDLPPHQQYRRSNIHRETPPLQSPVPSDRSFQPDFGELSLDPARSASPQADRKRSREAEDLPEEPPPEKLQNQGGLRMSLQAQLTNQQLLVKEVAGLYRAVCIAEEKCLHEDAKFRNLRGPDGRLAQLSENQYRALLMLHNALFSEINDFLLASQHPQASDELKQRARFLNIPARLWRVAIHSLLEILRHRLPESQEFLLSFMYTVYSNMTLLYETVPLFRDTWIECLGDLSRFRMAVEEINFKDREIWCGVSRFWYNISADRNPGVGRLQHHLAILARPNLLAQLHYYTKSLTVSEPFLNTRDSIRTLLDPVIQGTVFQHPYFQPSDILFIKLHGYLFLETNLADFPEQIEKFLILFEASLEILGQRNLERGPYFVVSNVATILGYGSPKNVITTDFSKANNHPLHLAAEEASTEPLAAGQTKMDIDASEQTLEAAILAGDESEVRRQIEAGIDVNSEGGVYKTPLSAAITIANPRMIRLLLAAGASVQEKGRHGNPMQGALFADTPAVTRIFETEAAMDGLFRSKRSLHSRMLALVLQRRQDDSLLSFVHSNLVFIHALTFHPDKMRFLCDSLPWKDLVAYLEHLRKSSPQAASILQTTAFPGRLSGIRPLPEDFVLRGLTWASHYFPEGYHENSGLELDERNLERPSQKEDRQKRILWLGKEIAAKGQFLTLDSDFHFGLGPQVVCL